MKEDGFNCLRVPACRRTGLCCGGQVWFPSAESLALLVVLVDSDIGRFFLTSSDE